MKKLIYFSLFTVLITSCGKFNSCKTYYTFEMPVTISPVKDTISIGDTLWFEINVSSMLKDRESNTVIDVKDQMLTWDQNMAILFQKITNPEVNLNGQSEAVSEFSFFSQRGLILDSGNNLHKLFEFEYVNNEYFLKFGIVPQESGIYFLKFAFNNKSTNVHDSEFEVNLVETECKEILHQIYYKVNEQNDGSYNTNRDILISNTSLESDNLYGKEVYTFIVE